MRGQWNIKSTEPKVCETCLLPMERRRHQSGRLEGYRDFVKAPFLLSFLRQLEEQGWRKPERLPVYMRGSW
jgi:hypothetical protein